MWGEQVAFKDKKNPSQLVSFAIPDKIEIKKVSRGVEGF